MTPELEAAYAEPHRRYHTRAHIEDCLAQLNAVEGLTGPERRLLTWAIWWHDAIYDPTRADNEALSADMAERDLADMGVAPAERAEVARLIGLTAGHTVEPGDRLGAVLVSIDLSILGRPPEIYDRYAAAIREEYGFVPDDAYRTGRAAVLRRFLDAPVLYPDLAFREQFEAQARANLARELAALSASTSSMRLSDFDFDLPEDLIALRPSEPRDAARLLVVRPGTPFDDRIVRDLPDLLQPGDALVFNDTRVIPARLDGVRIRDESIIPVEATLHKRLSPSRWTAFMKPGKRLKPGDRLCFGAVGPTACELDRLDATLVEKLDGGEVVLEFDVSGPDLDLAIAAHGRMPLPPYIAGRRREDERDFRDYQTVFARHEGSVAAPTAGLHFTPELIERLKARGVSIHFVTLHVGAGTFLPVKTDEVSEHRMHAEWGEVSSATAAALNAARAGGGRLVCVGTTALRLIESATDEDGTIRPFAAETSIFITPGYRFRAADVLMTNFHLPCSTLFMLVSAFAGLEVMRAAYAHAIASGYRFYSYGDTSLLFRAA